jgi:hypothetical protein
LHSTDELAAAARQVTGVLPLLGPDYRLPGHADLVAELARGLPGLCPSVTFSWINTFAAGKPGPLTPADGGQRPETVQIYQRLGLVFRPVKAVRADLARS